MRDSLFFFQVKKLGWVQLCWLIQNAVGSLRSLTLREPAPLAERGSMSLAMLLRSPKWIHEADSVLVQASTELRAKQLKGLNCEPELTQVVLPGHTQRCE